MDEDYNNTEDIDSVMRSSYLSLTSNIEETLKEFIVFNNSGDLIEINGQVEEKCQFIDKLINYFELTEEFEKCQRLLNLKNIIVENKNNN
jgi:DNA-binding LytR/AlgR family response regulator